MGESIVRELITVGDLRKVLDGLADDMPVVTTGYPGITHRAGKRIVKAYFDPTKEGPVFRECLVLDS